MNRRFFLLAAPAIVAAPSLMKISAAIRTPDETWDIEAINAGESAEPLTKLIGWAGNMTISNGFLNGILV